MLEMSEIFSEFLAEFGGCFEIFWDFWANNFQKSPKIHQIRPKNPKIFENLFFEIFEKMNNSIYFI